MTKKSLSSLIRRNRVYWEFSSDALVRESEGGEFIPIKFKALGREATLRLSRDFTLTEGGSEEALVGDLFTGEKGLAYVSKCLYDWDLGVPYDQKEFEQFLSEFERPEVDKFVRDFMTAQSEAFMDQTDASLKWERPTNRLPKSIPGSEEVTDEKK